MAILDGIEILLQDAASRDAITEFHTKDSHDSTTVRSVTRCIEVADGQQCSFKVRTLPDFQWHDGDCLRLVLDFDGGEIVNRYELYVLRECPRTRQLVNKEPVLRRAASNNWHESTIDYLYIRSDILDEYCQKGRLVFRKLRQDDERPGGRKTVAQMRNDQGRIRIEVTRLQVEELSEAKEILLLRPPKRGRSHTELLEKKGIYIETRVKLDDHYERLPKRKFITRAIEEIEGKKQLNFVFEYRKEGVLKPYYTSSSEADASNLLLDESSLSPEDVHSNEPQTSIRTRDEQPLGDSVSPTPTQQDPGAQMALGIDSEATMEIEEARGAQEVIVVDTGTSIDCHAMRGQQPGPAPTKLEDDEIAHSTKDTVSSRWLTGLGDDHEQLSRESVKSHSTELIFSPTCCQTLITRIRNAESLIDAEQQRIEEDDEIHEQLLSSLKETELEYRQAKYLQRQEQKRERQTLIARIEALNQGIEQERRLFEVERVKLQALLESQEKALVELRKSNSGSDLLQHDPKEALREMCEKSMREAPWFKVVWNQKTFGLVIALYAMNDPVYMRRFSPTLAAELRPCMFPINPISIGADTFSMEASELDPSITLSVTPASRKTRLL